GAWEKSAPRDSHPFLLRGRTHSVGFFSPRRPTPPRCNPASVYVPPASWSALTYVLPVSTVTRTFAPAEAAAPAPPTAVSRTNAATRATTPNKGRLLVRPTLPGPRDDTGLRYVRHSMRSPPPIERAPALSRALYRIRDQAALPNVPPVHRGSHCIRRAPRSRLVNETVGVARDVPTL